MRKRSRILLALLAAAILSGLGWLAFKPREPEYDGKTLTEWLAQGWAVKLAAYESHWGGHYRGYETASEWLAASNAVRHIGSNAIPSLLRMLEKKNFVTAKKLVRP